MDSENKEKEVEYVMYAVDNEAPYIISAENREEFERLSEESGKGLLKRLKRMGIDLKTKDEDN